MPGRLHLRLVWLAALLTVAPDPALAGAAGDAGAVAWGSGINKFLVARADARDTATPKKVDIFGRLVYG